MKKRMLQFLAFLASVFLLSLIQKFWAGTLPGMLGSSVTMVTAIVMAVKLLWAERETEEEEL